MLKKFFTVMLGSLAAIWLSIILLGVIIVVSAVLWLNKANEYTIPEHSFLYLDLSGEVTDHTPEMSVAELVIEGQSSVPTFEEILFSIRKAKTDDRIDAIFINLGQSLMSMAQREELVAALKDFKDSGKTVHVYSDEMTQGNFYIASIADKVTLNPAGYIDFRGMSLTVAFFKEALAKLGVEVQVLKVGTYKSAVEPFLLTEMSEANRIQYTELLESIWSDYLTTVTTNLSKKGYNYTPAQLDSLATNLTLINKTADELIKEGFITTSNYLTPSELTLRQDGDDYERFEERRIIPSHYLWSNSSVPSLLDVNGERSHIAVLFAEGDIVDYGYGGIAGDKYVKIINKLAEDDKVSALVMRVNSGGGSAFASEQIWAALENFKKTGKPFYVSMGGMAASGGYYISAGADKIFADRATLTGSIGIFGIVPYAQELLNDKLGITFSTVSTNPNATFPNIDRPLTTQQHEALEGHIKRGYELFVDRVAQGRNLTPAQVDSIGQGRVWTGAKAKELGLVDEIGGLWNALSEVGSKVNLDPLNDVVSYPLLNRTPLESILRELNSSLASNGPAPALNEGMLENLSERLGIKPSEIRKSLEFLSRVRSMSTIQAKMEYITIE